MIDYQNRSLARELLDGNNIPFDDIAENMRELEFINAHLGGHSITIQGFKKLAGNKTTISVCEIGCGGGDNLNALDQFCKKSNINAKFTGIDINPECIAFAENNTRGADAKFIVSDYRLVDFQDKPDLIFSSLFCHHFTNEELVRMLRWMKGNASMGFFINDLHRNPLAYQFIKYATRLFSKSYLVKNDAPLSVLRGFKKTEWQQLFNQAGIEHYFIQWKWAFRFLITVQGNDIK